MKVSLVTGGAGFIGSHLVDHLIGQGDVVFVIDNLSTGVRENINPKAEFVELDLTDAKATKAVLLNIKPNRVFHLAALARIQPSIKDPIKWNNHNTNATLNLLWACKLAGVEKFVYSGSSSIYGSNQPPFREDMTPLPMSPYALSKYFGEQYCYLFSHLYGLDTTVLRYFNVYGPRQVLEGDYATVIGIFMQQFKDGKKLTIVGDGTQKRDFTWVHDVCDANIKASEREGFGTYNIGTCSNYEIRDIAKMIQPEEEQHEYGMIRVNESKETLANIDNAMNDLGWKPMITVEKGIDLLMNGSRNGCKTCRD